MIVRWSMNSENCKVSSMNLMVSAKLIKLKLISASSIHDRMNDLATVMFVAGAVTHRTVKVGLRALAIAAAWADARLLPIDSITLLRYSDLKLAWLEV